MAQQKESNSNSNNIRVHRDTTTLTIIRLGDRSIRVKPVYVWSSLVLAGLIVSIVLLFPYTTSIQQFTLPHVGDVSGQDIIAPISFDVMKSPVALEKERKEAMSRALMVFTMSREVDRQVIQILDNLEKTNKAMKTDLEDSMRIDEYSQQLISSLPQELINVISRKEAFFQDAIAQLKKAYRNGIIDMLLAPSSEKLVETKDHFEGEFEKFLIYDKPFILVLRDSQELTMRYNVPVVKEIAVETIVGFFRKKYRLDSGTGAALTKFFMEIVKPNVVYDENETQKRREESAKNIVPVKGKVIKDAEIVRKHQEVTPEILEKLESLQRALLIKSTGTETRLIIAANTGKVLLIIVFLVLISIYVWTQYKELFMKNSRHILAFGCIIVFQLAIIRIALWIIPKIVETGTHADILPHYAIPTAVASILCALLFSIPLSIIVSFFIALFCGVAFSFNYYLFFYILFGGFIAGYATHRIRYRWDFFKAIPPLLGIYILFVVLWGLTNNSLEPYDLARNMGLNLVNCIITIFFAMMAVTALEYVFDIITDMKLIELADMNHPLLKRLSIEAAGTYNHSVLVGNLAESAAAKINANSLLARVAAYYHDVGKIARPNYFVENQKAERNIHDKLSPNMSALIIVSHVKEGLELAKRYKIPGIIRDAILEHHGNSSVSFFYEKALEQDPHKQVDELDFCYPGPRPQTKENAILMLADSVEAACRSLSVSSPKILRALVQKIIRDKFTSSQLDECDLTFLDVEKIIEGFMPVLEGMFHTRIEYPK